MLGTASTDRYERAAVDAAGVLGQLCMDGNQGSGSSGQVAMSRNAWSSTTTPSAWVPGTRRDEAR